jgi:hypothetical protein
MQLVTELSRRLGLARSQPPNVIAVSTSGTCEQILDNCADLHELIQANCLGDEADNSKTLEQRLIPPGPRRTPHANWNADEVFCCPNLSRDLVASVLGEV